MAYESTKQRSSTADYSETLHALNQRYKQAWDRTEHLQDELDHIKKSAGYRLACWLRRLAGFWGSSPAPEIGRLSSPPFGIENLDDQVGPATGSVTILIPFRDHFGLLRNCLRSLRRGSYGQVEILLLDNGSTCPRTLRFLRRGELRDRFKVIPCPGPFNFARLCNLGARKATGEFVLFLNNDTEILARDWLEQLLHLGNCPGVGVVGATLLYPDATIQHAGVFPGESGMWSHVYRGQPHDFPGDNGELTHARAVPAVTGACLLIRRDLFHKLGGFDEKFALTFNDIDLCRRVRERGLKIAITPHARLWHFESMTRGFSRELLSLS
jgi:GT2 family glycosyltransferase